MSVFDIAIVGGGVISRAHLAAARNSGGRVRVVASVDRDDSARKALADATGGAPVFASADELFRADVKLDGLVLCTPPSVRIPIVRPALERGLAVLVEKPLAHTLEGARELADLAHKHPNVAAAVGYCHRFVPAVNEMKRRLGTGELGELVRVENVFASYFPAMLERWMSDPAVSGGGSFIDTGCHSLDLVRYLAGDGQVVSAIFRHDWPGRGESSATVVVKSGQTAGVIESGWLEPARFKLNLVGTRGLLSYDYDRPTELVLRPSEGTTQVLEVGSHETRFDQQMLAFAAFAQGGGRGNLCGFTDGLRVAEMVDRARHLSII